MFCRATFIVNNEGWDVGMQESTMCGPTGLGPRFGAGRGGMSACRKAPSVAQLDWAPGSVQGGVGCRHAGKHQVWPNWTGPQVRCREGWDVGMQESTRCGPTGLGPRFGAGRGGMSACRKAPGVAQLDWAPGSVQGGVGCRHAGKHQVWPNWTGPQVRCREGWCVGMQDRNRVASPVLMLMTEYSLCGMSGTGQP